MNAYNAAKSMNAYNAIKSVKAYAASDVNELQIKYLFTFPSLSALLAAFWLFAII